MATVLDTNAVGIVRVMHAFLPLLRRSGPGVVVNVGSGLGSFGRVGVSSVPIGTSLAPMLGTGYARDMASRQDRNRPAPGLPDAKDDESLRETGPPLDRAWAKEARRIRRRRGARKVIEVSVELGLEVLSIWP